jgi:hypothetical protein
MMLIPEWRKAWRMLSVQAMTWAAVAQGVWLELPAEHKAELPPHLVHYVTIGLLVFGVYGRIVKQKKVSGK